MHAIEVRDVTKVYRRYGHRRQFATLKSAILSGSFVSRPARRRDVPGAARTCRSTCQAGRTFGIIGRNGSGKSTMLKCVAGITKPTRGTVTVNGRISALIELGAGFHPEISGRENVFINGIMLGLSKREITRRFDEIVEFAELEDFIDAPVKTYSSGMYMRLGFAVAIHVDPDVLLVDEVLAVGDEGFTHKCLDKFGEFRRRGKTILLVTHSLGLVERFCDEALWLDGGRVRGTGDPRRVVGAYVTAVEKSEEEQLAAGGRPRARERRPRPPCPPPSRRRTIRSRSEPTATPQDMFLATAGRWGSREVGDHRRHLPRRGRHARPRLPLRRAADRAARRPGRDAGDRLRVRLRALQRGRRLLSTAPTPISRTWCRRRSTAADRSTSSSTRST